MENLKWSPQLESIEDYVQKINQLATALGKTEPDKVLKLKYQLQIKQFTCSLWLVPLHKKLWQQSINSRPCHIFSNQVLQG